MKGAGGEGGKGQKGRRVWCSAPPETEVWLRH